MAIVAAVLREVRQAIVDRSVVIIGQGNLQNRLVADLIDERLGCACQVRTLPQSDGLPVPNGAIALVDVGGMSRQHVNGYARAVLASGPYRGVALINAEEASVRHVYAPGVCGVFSRDTSQADLLKGLRAMLGGERQATIAARITRMEAETLKLLVVGHSNREIARRLGVSPHTVKTHLYNVFRKIGATNRVQAVKWGLENLTSPRRASD